MTTKTSGGAGKDTIYIDVDDEITTIIDKLQSSPEKIVALVLPKRATVLQSVVNMKLLKRTADNSSKHLVLITTEAALMPLAGAVGLYVAATPQSKPEIPVANSVAGDDVIEDAVLDDEPAPSFTAENAGDRPVGELARRSGTVAAGGAAGVAAIETLSLDNDDEEIDDSSDAAVVSAAPKNKKLKVPNFNRFRMLIGLAGLAIVLLIVGLVVALKVLPKAVITIDTDASDINSSLTLTLDTSAKALYNSALIVPAKVAQEQKTQSTQVAATGSKNNGEKASGSVTMNAGSCSADVPSDVPAGAGLSTGGQTYITQESTSFMPRVQSGKCSYQSSSSTKIVAQSGGAKYNTEDSTFSVAGRSNVTASGSASGGTDNIVKVVQQTDIDSAKQKISTAADTSSLKESLVEELRIDDLYALPDTFDAGEPSVTSSSNVGDQTDSVTVTATYTYTMYGVEKKDLETLIKDDVNSQVDTSKETILDSGLDRAKAKVTSSDATTKKVNFSTTAVVGPDLHLDDLKKAAAGKKSGDVVPMIKNLPGVTEVNVKLSPFWVSSVPNNQDKITMVVKKASDQ
jgi:hypothetical protein